MTVRPLLMGVETEYAVTAFRNGSGAGGELAEQFLPSAKRRFPHVIDGVSSIGVYLGNGARFYVDAGSHPEFATPECSNPYEVVTYIRAGERMLLEVARDVAWRAGNGTELAVFRGNVDYSGDRTTWGCHESYLYRGSPRTLATLLIPHLVSRVIYSGAGGFDPLSDGLQFTLSPRVSMLERVISDGSTTNRGIFHTKDETLGPPGYHRLHVLCGESLCCDLGVLLKVGATALIVAAIDAGMIELEGLELHSPLEAMRTIAADPACRVCVPLKSGEAVSAIELQRRYLRQVENASAAGHLPEWAGGVCTLWGDALERLARDPGWAERTLDWGIKRALFERWAGGTAAWQALGESSTLWLRVKKAIEAGASSAAEGTPRSFLQRMLDARSPRPPQVARVRRMLRRKGTVGAELQRFLALRDQLLEIDIRFGQLGERGIFESLAGRGMLHGQLVGADEIERAQRDPPPVGRAKVRGELVQKIHGFGGGSTHACSWMRLWNLQNRDYADFVDPFESEVRWRRTDEPLAPTDWIEPEFLSAFGR